MDASSKDVRRYSFSLFEPLAALSDSHKRRKALPKIKLPTPRPISGKRAADHLGSLVNACLTADEGERSEVDYHLCCEAVEHGWAKDEVQKAVEGIGKFGERGEEYFERTWAKAEHHTRVKTYEDHVAKRAGKAESHPAGSGKTDDDALSAIVELHSSALKAINLEVIGRCKDGRIKVFSHSSRCVETIRSVQQYGYGDFSGLAGPVFVHLVEQYLDSDAPANGKFDLQTIRNAIGTCSHGKEIVEGEERGPGCWQCIGDSDQPAIAIVGDKNACEWTGTTLVERNHPRFRNLILDFESQNYQQWYDFNELKEEIRKCSDVEYRREIFHELLGILTRWNWNHESMPLTATGAILATWIQTIWKWRPQILVRGETNSGKSTLFLTLRALYGHLALMSSQSSAAGLRQALETTARIPLCDEFDVHSKHQKIEQDKILKMIRDSGRGNETIRGTSHQKSQHFTLRHIFWMAGTNVEFTDATDKNRFIIFELEPAAAGKENQLESPSDPELKKLGIKTFAAAISVAFRAMNLSVHLMRSTRKHDFAHSRQVESYSVPAAMVAAICGDTDGEAERLMESMMAPVVEQEDLQIRKDHETLLEDILTAHIPLRSPLQRPVSQWLLNAWKNSSTEASDVLEHYGMKMDYMTKRDAERIAGATEGDRCLMIQPTVVRKSVLQGTQWHASGFRNAIKGLRRWSTESKRRIGGFNTGTIVIDWRAIEGYLSAEDGSDQHESINGEF